MAAAGPKVLAVDVEGAASSTKARQVAEVGTVAGLRHLRSVPYPPPALRRSRAGHEAGE